MDERTRSSTGTAAYTQDQTLWRAATVLADDEAPPAAVTASAEGDVAGERRYELREVLGAGGMGEVRLCRDESLGRDVAYKTLHAGRDADARARRAFLREARVQGQLEHPSIVPVYDLGVGAAGGLYFTMRRVRGRTLGEVIAGLAAGDAALQARYSRRKLLDAFVRVCLAVDYAHSRGVLHRDLKPSNVMLGDFGEVYVLDWGVARLVTERATDAPVVVPAAERGGQGSTVGTPGYMSPEQLLGRGDEQDARTDVYALGAMLYEILALRRLHRGDSVRALAASTLSPDVDPRPSLVAPDVSPELDAACARALAPERERRFAGARELAEAVERFLDGDRDLARRRELAGEKAERAEGITERARDAAATPEAREAARAEAMREVVGALALDPEHAGARRLLVESLVEVPDKLPASVESEMDEALTRSRIQAARFGFVALISWWLTIPVAVWIGVRDWASFAVPALGVTAAAALAAWVWRSGTVSRSMALVLAALIAVTVGGLSCWLGPFVLVPTASATTTIWLTLQAENRQRPLLALLGGLTMAVPFFLEHLHLVPPSMAVEGDRVTLFARGLHYPPGLTVFAMLYSNIGFTVLQPFLLGGVRDNLASAERRLYLQAWRLRQLLPGAAAPSVRA